jgi:opacity protein-like surface antigen
MKKALVVMVALVAITCAALAQDFPKYEVFGGYSHLRSDLNNNSPFFDAYYSYGEFNGGAGNLNGFEASFSYNLNNWIGIKADFSSQSGKHHMDNSWVSEDADYYDAEDYSYYNKYTHDQKGTADVRHYTYLFGPEFSYRGNAKLRPFAHALFGFSRVNVRKLSIHWSQLREYDDYFSENPQYAEFYEGSITGAFSNTSFGMALGGGLDISVNDRFSVRAVQIDYIPAFRDIKTQINSDYSKYSGSDAQSPMEYREVLSEPLRMPADRNNNLRLSAGVVIRF